MFFKRLRIKPFDSKKLFVVECFLMDNDKSVRRFEVVVKAHSKWHARKVAEERLSIKAKKVWKNKKRRFV